MESTKIADTTMEQRIEIIKRWIPEDEAMDGCDLDLWELYDDYIRGIREISECNARFSEKYLGR